MWGVPGAWSSPGSMCGELQGHTETWLTQDIDAAPGDAVKTGADGRLVAHVQLLHLQRPAQR